MRQVSTNLFYFEEVQGQDELPEKQKQVEELLSKKPISKKEIISHPNDLSEASEQSDQEHSEEKDISQHLLVEEST